MCVRSGSIVSILIISSLLWAENPSTEHKSTSTYMGASIGLPSFLAVSLETNLGDKAVLGLQAGTLIFAHSFGARIILGSNDPGWSFRYFAGATIINKWYGEYYYDPNGTSGHGWLGVNVALNEDEWRLVLETGGLLGGDPDKGFGYSGFTFTWGVSLLYSL